MAEVGGSIPLPAYHHFEQIRRPDGRRWGLEDQGDEPPDACPAQSGESEPNADCGGCGQAAAIAFDL